jgi:LCP family protein required for cell wall assembly
VNEWPAGWFRDQKPAPSQGAGSPGTTPAGSNDRTVGLPAGGASAGAGHAGFGNSPSTLWPEQPPLRAAGDDSRPWPPSPPLGAGRGRRGPRPGRVLRILASLVVVLLIVVVGLYFYLDSKLNRSNVLVDYQGRPAAAAGQTWLITGSDSRQGLTRSQERRLATGVDISGHRSDTILLLHIPGNGGPAVLISVPRDSYVPIPGYGYNKINAAYSFGGPRLLAETLQNVTGLRIDHYMGIGFGGLVNVVNAVGGVRMCLPRPLNDPAAGLHLRRGCQNLSGAQALGFVRTRHTFTSQDLQREQNQRIFIRALLTKMTSAGTLANPFAVLPAALGSVGALKVDNGTHLYQLVSVAFALRHPETTTVPIANSNLITPVGDAVQWDRTRALELFNDLRADRRVPKSLLTGSRLAG